MLMKRTVKCCLAFSVLAFGAIVFAGESTNNDLPAVVRTLKDIEQGRKNVESVLRSLSEMFSADATFPAMTVKPKKLLPAYHRIIKGENNRSTLVYRPRFSKAERLYKALDGVVVGSVLIEQVKEENMLVLNAPDKEISTYLEILRSLDVPGAQLLIEAKVVEVTFKDETLRNLSINYTTGGNTFGATTQIPGATAQPTSGLGANFNPLTGKDKLDISFKWLQLAQDAKILSAPNILLSRNETSRIVTGQDIPIQEANSTSSTLQMSTKYKSVGVKLEVEPQMINDDCVTLRLWPQVSSITKNEQIAVGGSAYSVPVIAVRSIESYLRLYDKQVVMMGGLYSSRTALEEEKIPILGDLPFLGELFKGKNATKEVTQLIFFLKVHIIPAEKDHNGILYNPYSTAKTSELYGDMLQSAKSNPLHESAMINLFKDMGDTLPGKKEEKREKFMKNMTDVFDGKAAANTEPQKKDNAKPAAQEKQKKDNAKPAAQEKQKKDNAKPAAQEKQKKDNVKPAAQKNKTANKAAAK
ncbi:MAG: hypothetical protein IKA87_02970 [Lentisphaeria bacterium]|nr:hypothetical protein [Lentisphaeria bacterium]